MTADPTCTICDGPLPQGHASGFLRATNGCINFDLCDRCAGGLTRILIYGVIYKPEKPAS